MLFPLNQNTPQCRVFEVLNNQVLYFLQASISANNFSECLFSRYEVGGESFVSICWENEPTREKFKGLWDCLPSDQQGRQELCDGVRAAQEIDVYFNDTSAQMPVLEGESLFDAFKALTTHLFTRTKDLAGAKREAGSSIERHFQEFRQANDNSQLCYLCGTAHLSQDREALDSDDQWRADYDHILCKDKYPIYSVHPGNFIPTCHICNSKAKGAKNVLLCKRSHRRTAFYPLSKSNSESCYLYIKVEARFRKLSDLGDGHWEDPISSVDILFDSASDDIASKINVWNDVYQVTARVKKHIAAHFCERISSELINPVDFEDFCEMLRRASRCMPIDYKKAEWKFWWYRVLEYLGQQPPNFLYDVWSLIEWKLNLLNDSDMQATYGL